MGQALDLARRAAGQKEVPVGAVAVWEGGAGLLKSAKTPVGEILGRGSNRREQSQNPLGHAELEAISQAAKRQGSWRLEGCALYVTLEPCLMCMGAILQSRISHLIYSCSDPKGGFQSLYRLRESPFWPPSYSRKLKITEGIMAKESAALLKDFFRQIRKGPCGKGGGKR